MHTNKFGNSGSFHRTNVVHGVTPFHSALVDTNVGQLSGTGVATTRLELKPVDGIDR